MPSQEPLSYDPYAEELIENPLPVYARLREEAPAYFVPEFECWFLSRFEDIWRCGQDTQSFTVTDGVLPTQLAVPVSEQSALGDMLDEGGFGDSLALIDPPRHTSYRSGISSSFKPGAVAELEPFTRDWVRGLVGGVVDAGRCDVVGDLAMKTSVRVASRMIGLPEEDAALFVDWINTHFDRIPGQRGMTEKGIIATLRLGEYLQHFVARARKEGASEETLVGRLFAVSVEGERLRDEDVTAMTLLALIGGTETLPKALAAAVYRLGQFPEQRAQVAADPGLARAAFEEALRFDMPTQMLGRRVKRDLSLRGETLRTGQGVLFLYASGNRDEREFPEPDRFDIHRAAKRVLSFGAGPHMCLGAHVARMEGRVMLQELLARIPEYEVDEANARRLHSELFQGWAELPIRF